MRCSTQRGGNWGASCEKGKTRFSLFCKLFDNCPPCFHRKKKKEEEEESNARKTMLHFSTLEIDPIRLKFQSSKKGEPLSIAKYLQCRSNCNWRHISPLYYDTLSLSRKKLIPSEARQLVRTSVPAATTGFPRPITHLSRHLRGYRANVRHSRTTMLVSYAYLYLYRFCARIQNARIRRFHINFGAIKKHPGVSRPRQRLNTTSNVLTRLI